MKKPSPSWDAGEAVYDILSGYPAEGANGTQSTERKNLSLANPDGVVQVGAAGEQAAGNTDGRLARTLLGLVVGTAGVGHAVGVGYAGITTRSRASK